MAELGVQKENVDNLRRSDATTVSVLVADLLRLHIERIETTCVADLFALADAQLPSSLSADLKNWATRASRDIVDLPEGPARRAFLGEIGALPAGKVANRLRDAIKGMAVNGSAETIATLDELARAWEVEEAENVVLPTKPTKTVTGASAAGAAAAPRKAVGAPKRGFAAKTPAADVDPRRAAFVRDDAVNRLKEYGEKGLKESIFVAGIKHRSPFKDMTEAEIKTELRRLERERKVKHTGERWMIR